MIKSQCEDSKLHLFSAWMKRFPPLFLIFFSGPFAVSFDRICFICIFKKNINTTVLITSKSGNNLIPLKQFTLYIIMHVLNFKFYILIISVLAFYLIFNYFFSFAVFCIWLFLSSLLRVIYERVFVFKICPLLTDTFLI